MARRRDYLSFFNDRPRRNRAVFFDLGRRRRRLRPLLLLVVLAVSATAGWWFFFRDADEAPVAASSTTTTTVPLVQSLEDDSVLVVTPEAPPCPDDMVGWETFQGGPTRTGCVAAPTINEPTVIWRDRVGIQGWLNNPVVGNGLVYVGSAGDTQFEHDDRDGVHALDADTGSEAWFFDAELDVNGVAYSDGVVVAVGDEGKVWGIDASTGDELWSEPLGASGFGNPLVLDGVAIVGDGSGAVTAFDLRTGERAWRERVSGAVRGGVASDGELIYVIGEDGDAAAITQTGTVIWRRKLREAAPGFEEVRVFGAPTIVDDVVLVSLVRDDFADRPALIALQKETGNLRWQALDAADVKEDWANVRSSPAIVGGLAIYGEAYSTGVVAVDVASGETRWITDLGAICFPHWPSPAVVAGQVVIPRHDGALYAIDAASGRVAWSIYLGDTAQEGAFPEGYDDEFCQSRPRTGWSILSSPAISEDGVVYVGTLEGMLFAVADESWRP